MGTDSARLLATVPDLIHVSDDQPGWSRRRHGRGFRYFREDGQPITDAMIKNRLKSLAIPPAWTDVWICPLENGHLLSTGRDEANRKQYRYHPDWMAYQQLNKFQQLIDFAAQLPKARAMIRKIITDRSQGWNHDRVAALALAIMDETGMRVGNASYRQRNGTIGLTTLRRKHVETEDDALHFEYVGKSGIDRSVDLEDPTLIRLINNVSELPGYELLRYRGEDGRMHNLDSKDVNDLVKKLIGPDYSSKFFRTWAGTAAAVSEYWTLLEKTQGEMPERPDLRVTESVATFLGNTPAVCRKYYIHPAIMAGIVEGNLPGPDTITKEETAEFGEEFSAEEIVTYRVCSSKPARASQH